jgi:hypothetical protein
MRRCRKLVTCCSTVISITLLFACSLFVAFFQPALTTRSWIAYQLPMLLDQSTGKDFASFMRQAASRRFQMGERMRSEAANAKTHLGNRATAPAVIPPSALDSRANVSTTGSTASLYTKSPSEKRSRSDVAWLFDQQGGPSLFALSRDDRAATVTGFLIDGKNTSDQPMTDVQAVLIPDRNAGNLELALNLSEHSTNDPVQTIPPGAQFSLAYTFSKYLTGSSDTFVEKCGGAIFTFHYTHAGVHKAVIWYLSPSRLRTELRKAGALASLE